MTARSAPAGTSTRRPNDPVSRNEANDREMIRITLSSATRTNQPTPTFPTTWSELRKMVETAYYAPRD